jgi:hypothetical protein
MAIELISNIAPKNNQNFWLLDTIYGKGGKVEVADLAALNAIPLANRKKNMWGITQDDGQLYECDGDLSWVIKEIGGSSTSITKVAQTAHGFVIGDVIGYDSNQYVKVIANDTDDTDALGIVTFVTDVNNFEVATSGYINIVGFNTYADDVIESFPTPNTTYFLSYTTPGRLELNEPSLSGQIKKAILITLSNTVGVVQIGTGYLIQETVGGDAGYYTIQKDGVSLPQQDIINFTGVAVTVTNDAPNNRTNVAFSVSGHGVHTGDVTSGGPDNLVTTIGNNKVSNAKLTDMAANTIKGRLTSTGDPQDLTASQVRTLLAVASGTTNRIAKFTTAETLGNSNLTDNGSNLTVSYLAGSGNRMVIANASGTLSTQTIPSPGIGSMIINGGGTPIATGISYFYSDGSVTSATIVGTLGLATINITNNFGIPRFYRVYGQVRVSSDNSSNDDFRLRLRVNSVVVDENHTRSLFWKSLTTDGGEILHVSTVLRLDNGYSATVDTQLHSFGIGWRSGSILYAYAI